LSLFLFLTSISDKLQEIYQANLEIATGASSEIIAEHNKLLVYDNEVTDYFNTFFETYQMSYEEVRSVAIQLESYDSNYDRIEKQKSQMKHILNTYRCENEELERQLNSVQKDVQDIVDSIIVE
jgi:hypothetical protein